MLSVCAVGGAQHQVRCAVGGAQHWVGCAVGGAQHWVGSLSESSLSMHDCLHKIAVIYLLSLLPLPLPLPPPLTQQLAETTSTAAVPVSAVLTTAASLLVALAAQASMFSLPAS